MSRGNINAKQMICRICNKRTTYWKWVNGRCLCLACAPKQVERGVKTKRTARDEEYLVLLRKHLGVGT